MNFFLYILLRILCPFWICGLSLFLQRCKILNPHLCLSSLSPAPSPFSSSDPVYIKLSHCIFYTSYCVSVYFTLSLSVILWLILLCFCLLCSVWCQIHPQCFKFWLFFMCRSYVVTRNSACLFYSIYCIAFYNFLFLIVISQFVLCLFTFVRCSYFTVSHNFSVRRLWCGVCYILLIPTSSCFLAPC